MQYNTVKHSFLNWVISLHEYDMATQFTLCCLLVAYFWPDHLNELYMVAFLTLRCSLTSKSFIFQVLLLTELDSAAQTVYPVFPSVTWNWALWVELELDLWVKKICSPCKGLTVAYWLKHYHPLACGGWLNCSVQFYCLFVSSSQRS